MTHSASLLAVALASALMIAGCSGGDAPAGHASAAPTSSSAGLPNGKVDAGEQLAHAKGKATGQSCVDCHGEAGNAPIDASYPKLGGQYADYLAHALQQYRGGKREHALMSQQAKDLTDQQIADLAAYFGSRESHLRDLQGVNR